MQLVAWKRDAAAHELERVADEGEVAGHRLRPVAPVVEPEGRRLRCLAMQQAVVGERLHAVRRPVAEIEGAKSPALEGVAPLPDMLQVQAGAVAHGIARALQKMNAELRAPLKKAGHLKRDPRAKERKKPGQPGARKRFQFSKR